MRNNFIKITLIASLLFTSTNNTMANTNKQLVCEIVTTKTTWKDVDVKKSLYGFVTMSSYFLWKDNQFDLLAHRLFNDGANQVTGHPFMIFGLMLGKEAIDVTGFGWKDVLIGNAPAFLYYTNWKKAYRTAMRFLGKEVKEVEEKPFVMRDNEGNRYRCRFESTELVMSYNEHIKNMRIKEEQ